MRTRNFIQRQLNTRVNAFVLILFILSLILHSTVPITASESVQEDAHEDYDLDSFWGSDQVQQQYERLDGIRTEKARIEALLNDAKNREKNLVNELNYLSNLIKYTEYDINETMLEIGQIQELLAQVEGDIDSLSIKTGVLGEGIGNLERSYHARVRSSYQNQFIPRIGVFLESEGINDAVLRFAYLQRMQEEDKSFLDKLRGTKEEYTNRTNQLEKYKSDKETLKSQYEAEYAYLEQKKVDLGKQQATQGWLLGQTKNEEAAYQNLIAQIESEISAIRAALTAQGISLGTVNRGDVIGFLGNTGCSTGPHVHFGYYINGVAVNPYPYISSGELGWPVAAPNVTQYYGENYDWYMSLFGMPGHNGIDITDSLLPGQGAPVLASKGGTAYAVTESAPCSLTGTRGVGVRIDHPDGTKTIYWHLQSR